MTLREQAAFVTTQLLMLRIAQKLQELPLDAQFKDLKTHMKAQHPSWNPEQAAEAIAAKTEG